MNDPFTTGECPVCTAPAGQACYHEPGEWQFPETNDAELKALYRMIEAGCHKARYAPPAHVVSVPATKVIGFPLNREEVREVLLQLARGEITAVEKNSLPPQVETGNRTFVTSTGWHIVIFGNFSRMRYVGAAKSPDGRAADYDYWCNASGDNNPLPENLSIVTPFNPLAKALKWAPAVSAPANPTEAPLPWHVRLARPGESAHIVAANGQVLAEVFEAEWADAIVKCVNGAKAALENSSPAPVRANPRTENTTALNQEDKSAMTTAVFNKEGNCKSGDFLAYTSERRPGTIYFEQEGPVGSLEIMALKIPQAEALRAWLNKLLSHGETDKQLPDNQGGNP